MTEALLAVFSAKRTRGVNAPTAEETYDWRKPPGAPENRARVVAHGTVLGVEAAFARRWASDAHFVPYVLFGPNGDPLSTQPRVNKGGLAWVLAQGYAVRARSAWADLDNPGHAPWSEAMTDAAFEQARTVEALRTGPWYFTGRGRRVGVLWDRWVDVGELERMLDAWHDELEKQGLAPDRSCRDWTRLYRCPWIVREDGLVQRQLAWLDGAAEVAPPAVDPARPRWVRPKAATAGVAVVFGAELAPEWRSRVAVLSEAVRAVESEWHTLVLALAGSLCQRGAALGQVPAIVAAVFAATGADDRARDRLDAARTTVRRFAAGEPITGEDHLLVGWPGVHGALAQVLPKGGPRAPVPALPTAAQAAREVERAIREAPDGVSLVAAGCGVGKTRAAIVVARERARRGRTPGGRVTLGARTAISLPTNALARQVAADLRARGVPALRLFSPPSELGADGQPVCKFVDSARAMAEGRFSVPWELCEGRGQDPCPHRAACPAAEGREGDPEALVVVGNHGLLGAVVKSAGRTGLRVIDEPPALLGTVAFNAMDLGAFRMLAHVFAAAFVDAVHPVLSYLFDALEAMEPGGPSLPLLDVLPGELVDAVRAGDALPSPPARYAYVRRAREQSSFAADLGRAARLAWSAYLAVRSEAAQVVRREDRRGVPTLLLTGPDEGFVAALRADGTAVVLDADPDVAALSAAAGYPLASRVTRVWARDGAPVERTHLQWSQGSRRALFEGGALRLDRFAGALRAALAWAAEAPDARTLGVLTLAPFRAALDVALRPGDEAAEREARRRGLTARQVTEARDVLRPVLAAWPGEILPGHYGALRGLDAWKDVDALVTLADPWPHLGEVRNDVAYLGGEGSEARAEWLARAELEQAHGRLRAPHRERPARALHVGRLVPGGPGWETALQRAFATGRPKNDAAASADELRTWIAREHRGSIRAAAKGLGISHTAVRRYLTEGRSIPVTIASAIAPSGTERSVERPSNRAFGSTFRAPAMVATTEVSVPLGPKGLPREQGGATVGTDARPPEPIAPETPTASALARGAAETSVEESSNRAFGRTPRPTPGVPSTELSAAPAPDAVPNQSDGAPVGPA